MRSVLDESQTCCSLSILAKWYGSMTSPFVIKYCACSTGLVLGAIIRYGSPEPKKPSVLVELPANSSYDSSNLPDSLRLRVYAGTNNTEPNYHQYNYDKRIDETSVTDVELEEKVNFVLV